MSPSPTAPSSASHTAWIAQSPSECPRARARAAPGCRPASAGVPPPAGARRSRADPQLAHARTAPCSSPSAQARSSGVVILRLRGEPGTAATAAPSRSTAMASSRDRHPIAEGVLVGRRPAARAGSPGASGPRPSSSRSSVSRTRPSRTRLIVSGQGARAAPPRSPRRPPRLDQVDLHEGTRGVVHQHDAVEAVGHLLQALQDRVLAAGPARYHREEASRRCEQLTGHLDRSAPAPRRRCPRPKGRPRRPEPPAAAGTAPPSSRKALGGAAPMRSPRPAATRMATAGMMRGRLPAARRRVKPRGPGGLRQTRVGRQPLGEAASPGQLPARSVVARVA